MGNLRHCAGFAPDAPHYGELTISLLARRDQRRLHLLTKQELFQFRGCSDDRRSESPGTTRRCVSRRTTSIRTDKARWLSPSAACWAFQLLPRLKAIHAQKLYRAEAGQPETYPNLQLVLTRPIDWQLIQQQYDQMIKYATALRLGTAETEAILNASPATISSIPSYVGFAELGKAIKTIFLCRYLHSEALRREIQEGLNVIETWNGTNSFILYSKGGEIATNDLENQELTMLALHLLQICLVYINTLMIQRVLTEPDWTQRMLADVLRALTPLIVRSRDSLRDFSARHESEAGDRTRCGCCMMLRAALLCPW